MIFLSKPGGVRPARTRRKASRAWFSVTAATAVVGAQTFETSFLTDLPADYEVETLTGRDVDHWDEVPRQAESDEQTRRLLEELGYGDDHPPLHSGAVGYLSWNGNMDTAIAIRTAVIKNGQLSIQAGAGIVYDSVPENEWAETMNKARAIFRAVALAEAGLNSGN